MHGQRFEQALPLLESCFQAAPYRTDVAQVLATCQMQLGLLGQSHAALRRWPDAEEAVSRLLVADPHSPQGHLLLTRIRLHTNRAAEAADSALDAIGLQYGNPRGHFLLGMALAQDERLEEAVRPLTNCLQLAPEFLQARRLLSRVYRRLGRPAEAAVEEAQSFETMRRVRERRRVREADVRVAAEARAAVRAEQDRQLQADADRKAAELAAIEPLDLLVVSGLPRSGTSLMMQMLRAGGIEPMTDGTRKPDDDNPEGYWEWEDVKKLPKNPRLIEQAAGKAVKVISALLPSLPPPHRYTVIYMVRPVEQVIDSRWVMLARQGQNLKSEKQHLIDVQEHHSLQIRAALAASDRVTLVEVSYPDLVADPAPVIARLADVLPGRFQASPAVAACVKPALHRNR